ncbi:unnamed protein product [Musa hybrid cultivar]
MAAAGSAERRPGPPPPRKPAPGQPWSHIETAHLIDSYEERWYALKRGQLKAQQWEDVAATVAARCGLDEPSKTGTQCRHKIEKLRKRYRAERLRPVPSAWPFFGRMDRMERGPLPLSIRPPGRPPPSSALSTDEDDADDNDDEGERAGSNTRSINGILREPNWGPSKVRRNHVLPKRRNFEVEEGDSEQEESEGEGASGVEAMSQLAAAMRGFSDTLVRMEKRRMELMREMERDWMEMETKRAEMLRESQRCLLDMIADAFPSFKKAKKLLESNQMKDEKAFILSGPCLASSLTTNG